jgi:hypothetical protein
VVDYYVVVSSNSAEEIVIELVVPSTTPTSPPAPPRSLPVFAILLLFRRHPLLHDDNHKRGDRVTSAKPVHEADAISRLQVLPEQRRFFRSFSPGGTRGSSYPTASRYLAAGIRRERKRVWLGVLDVADDPCDLLIRGFFRVLILSVAGESQAHYRGATRGTRHQTSPKPGRHYFTLASQKAAIPVFTNFYASAHYGNTLVASTSPVTPVTFLATATDAAMASALFGGRIR